MERLSRSHVLVVGLGGVGAYAAEQICRAGVGKMTIIDADTVNESNINRQLPALHSTLPLFAKNVELGGTSEGIGVDVFDFDPLASMQDRTRNSISSMFTGEKPDSVAKEIQSEIDK